MQSNKPTYATAAATRRAINAFKGCGLQVGSARLLPDGSIEIVASGMSASQRHADNDFDKLDAAGLL
jgi:acylphosphatase